MGFIEREYMESRAKYLHIVRCAAKRSHNCHEYLSWESVSPVLDVAYLRKCLWGQDVGYWMCPLHAPEVERAARPETKAELEAGKLLSERFGRPCTHEELRAYLYGDDKVSAHVWNFGLTRKKEPPAIDTSSILEDIVRQMAQRTEHLLQNLLAGHYQCWCLGDASHIEFGPDTFESENDLGRLEPKFRLTRSIKFFCNEHWKHGDVIVVEIN